MRISDWSSDVCSSDLCGAGAGLLAGAGRRLRLAGGRAGIVRPPWHADGRLVPLPGVRPVRGHLDRARRRAPGPAQAAAAAVFRVDILVRPGRAAGVLRAARRALEPAGGAPAARSEEHTSELQYLMRILYAVFCLNKKISIPLQ